MHSLHFVQVKLDICDICILDILASIASSMICILSANRLDTFAWQRTLCLHCCSCCQLFTDGHNYWQYEKKKKKACKIVNLRLQSSLNFCLQRTSFVASWWPLLRIGDQYESWQAQTLYHEQILEASTEWLNSMIDFGESNNLSYPAWPQHMCILDSVVPISSHIWNVFFKSSPLKWLVLHLVEE